VIAPVESRWRERAYRPRWINLSTIPPEVLKLIGKDAALRRRFFGVTTSSTTAPNARFVLHYNEVFTDAITRTQSPNSSYDAFYLLAFATYALGDEKVSGPTLARAFERLISPGRPVAVGVAGIYEAIGALRRGEHVDVNGATGALDFDLNTGESSFDQEILCVGVDDRGVANDAIESGLTFRSNEKTLSGTMRCP
jgi:branched-chain amino acid transport system substrate-binding protein